MAPEWCEACRRSAETLQQQLHFPRVCEGQPHSSPPLRVAAGGARSGYGAARPCRGGSGGRSDPNRSGKHRQANVRHRHAWFSWPCRVPTNSADCPRVTVPLQECQLKLIAANVAANTPLPGKVEASSGSSSGAATVSLSALFCRRRLSGRGGADGVGRILSLAAVPFPPQVLELDWEDRDDGLRACGEPVHLVRIINPLSGPYFSPRLRSARKLHTGECLSFLQVLMADCVYNEEIVGALLSTASALCGPGEETLCIVSLELRCGARESERKRRAPAFWPAGGNAGLMRTPSNCSLQIRRTSTS